MASVLRQLDEYVRSLSVKHRHGGVLIDTNLLIVLLIGRHNQAEFSKFAHTKGYRPDELDILHRFVACFSRIVTTPHILTEVNSLSAKLHDVTSFRRALAQDVLLFEERQCEARQIVANQYFERLGLTDAGVISIAHGEFLVLTDDFPLARVLESLNVDVLNFNRIRPLAWR